MENAKIKVLLLMRGNAGKEVANLKKALRKALGKNAAAYQGLSIGDEFDADTETALRTWQSGVGLVADELAQLKGLIGSIAGKTGGQHGFSRFIKLFQNLFSPQRHSKE